MPLPPISRATPFLAAILAVVLAACGGGGSSGTTAPGSTSAAGAVPTDDTGEEPAETLAPAGERAYFSFDSTLGRVVRVDPDGGAVDEILDIDGTAYAMTFGDGALWLGMDSGTVLRVDPAGAGLVAEIAPTSSDPLFDIAQADGAVWTLHGVPGAGTALTRIDTTTNTAGEPIKAATGISFYDVAAGDGAVWLVGTSPEKATTLYSVDPASGTITDKKVDMVIDAISVADGLVWLGGTIFPNGPVGVPGVGRYDPAADTLTTVELPQEPAAIAVGAGGVWAPVGASVDGSSLYRIDPATTKLVSTIPLGDAEGGTMRVTTGAGFVWVTTAGGDAYAVDPTDDSVAGAGDTPGTLGVFFP